jgi:hypothetical protein
MLVGWVLALALAGEPALEANPVADTSAGKPEEPKKVCVHQAQTGSHFRKRICATAEEWEERRRRDAEAIDRMNDRRSFCRDADC